MIRIATFLIAATLAFVTLGSAQAQVVCLGASNTAGKGVPASSAFPAQLAKLTGLRVRNAGRSGDTTAGMLTRLGSAVPNGTRVVVTQYGGNDRGSSDRQSNISQIESRLQARGISVVSADSAIRGAIQGGLTQADGIHLTEAGHRQVAQQLASSVR